MGDQDKIIGVVGTRNAVYTAIFGDYDNLITPVHQKRLRKQADFICFTDNPKIKSTFYKVILVEKPENDPFKSNRYYKILSHRVLPTYAKTLYVDANVLITTQDLDDIFNNCLEKASYSMFKHTLRNCLYEEAEWVLSDTRIDNSEVVRHQIQQYKNDGFPTNFGLIAGTFIIRNHADPEVQRFNDLWWKEVKYKSRRDQLSFDYIRWKTGMKINYLPGSWENNFIGIRKKHKFEVMKTRPSMKQRLISLAPPSLLKWYRYHRDPEFRLTVDIENELLRIRKLPSNDFVFETNLFGNKIKGNSKYSFLAQYKEIIEDGLYEFLTDNPSPLIIDCGTNIGLSLISFKLKNPACKIIGFEPDTNLYNFSLNNIRSMGFNNIHLNNKGVWKEDGSMSFHAEGSDAGRITSAMEKNVELKTIETVRLSSFIDQNVDFLKVDIEGAELEVLKECAGRLHYVQNIFIEYHSFEGKNQRLSEILKILEEADFRYYVKTAFDINPKPFTLNKTHLGMDFLVNIYGYKRQ